MMISPEGYLALLKGDSFEELVAERKRLVDEINELEEIVYEKVHKDERWQINPQPDVQYQMMLEYLSKLCILISEKYNKEIVWEEPLRES